MNHYNLAPGFKRRVNAILHALGYPLPSFVDGE
jgi:hypothetical protein